MTIFLNKKILGGHKTKRVQAMIKHMFLQNCGGTVFEVSSGISGWEIPFKTGAISEYVVIDVESQ